MCSSLSDEQDILHRRNAFIGQVNSVLCFFGKLPSAVKARLFHSYCISFYGCDLWDLSCSVVGNFCTGRVSLSQEFGTCPIKHTVITVVPFMWLPACL